jgi:hypothetical protein
MATRIRFNDPTGGGGLSDGDYGDITVSGGGAVLDIDTGAVDLGELASIATSRFLGRTTAGSGVVEELTPAQARAVAGLGLVTYGTFASRPGAPAVNDHHFVHGVPYFLRCESAGTWTARSLRHETALNLPGLNSLTAAAWTYVAGATGSPTLVDYEGGLTVSMVSTNGVGPNLHPYKIAMSPTWASWTRMELGFECSDQWANFVKYVATLRESGTGKLLHYGGGSNTGPKKLGQRGTGVTNINATPVVNDTSGGETALQFVAFVKNGTNVELYDSVDGVTWDFRETIAVTTPFTNPDEVGFSLCCDINGTATKKARMNVWHFKQT